jgi:hypothetical protein
LFRDAEWAGELRHALTKIRGNRQAARGRAHCSGAGV